MQMQEQTQGKIRVNRGNANASTRSENFSFIALAFAPVHTYFSLRLRLHLHLRHTSEPGLTTRNNMLLNKDYTTVVIKLRITRFLIHKFKIYSIFTSQQLQIKQLTIFRRSLPSNL